MIQFEQLPEINLQKNNYLKLERRKWKVEINLGSRIVKYLPLKQMNSNGVY